MTTLIIGCSTGGTGAAIARRLCALGQRVHLLGRTAATVHALRATLGEGCASAATVDVREVAAYEAALAQIAAQGGVTGLVYAAGSIPLKPLSRTSAVDMTEAFTLNTLGAMLAVKALAPTLAQGPAPGSVVLFSTVAASVGFPNHAAIAAAKAGVEGFTRAAAAELAPRVRVNAIAPSLTDTPLASRILSSEAMRRALGEAHPIPRVGSPEDLAQAALFLLNPEASGWVTGQVWAVDGGRSTLRHKN